MTGMQFGYLYAEAQGNSISLAVASFEPGRPIGPNADIETKPYRSVETNMAAAVEWAAGAWCGTMASRGLEDCVLLIDASCAEGVRPCRLYGQYLAGSIPAQAIRDKDHPYAMLAQAARRAVRRLPQTILSVVSDAAASYHDEMPARACASLAASWPDMSDGERGSVAGACQDLEKAWDGDDAASAYRAGARLADLLRTIFEKS